MAEPSSYERILDRMEQRGRRFERRGPDWSKVSCPGPSHKRGDRNPSLLIRRQPGRVRLRCYLPGCEDVDILAAIGFEVRDLFDDRREVRYPYEDGWTVHRSWDPKAGKKKIWQEGPESKTNGQPTQLYKLSETKAAVAAHKTILLVEGEDNADLINSLPEEERVGAFATSARMGADSFYLCDVEPLRGAWVLAVVDRDESGDDWARQVRAKVGGLAASLDFKRAKVEKERADAADHIMHGYSLDQLEPYTFPANPLLARKRTGSWLDAQIFAPLQWVIPDIIPEGYTLLVGAPKIGKSWLALSIALAVAAGSYMFGSIYVGQPRPVLLLALEDSDRRLQSRIRQLIPGDAIPQLFEYFTDLAPSEVVPVIEAWLEELPTDAKPLVLLDTIGKILPSALPGESQYQRDYKVSGRLQAISRSRPGTGLVGLHHDRKASADDFVESISGTNGLAAAADTILVINRPRNEAEGLLEITGRDVEENEYGTKLVNGNWTLLGDNLKEAANAGRTVAAKTNLGERSAEIVEFVTDHPEGVRAADVVAEFDMTPKDARTYLKRLHDAGRLRKPKRGLYTGVATVATNATQATDATGGTDIRAREDRQPTTDQVEAKIAEAMATEDWDRVAELEPFLDAAEG